MDVTQIGTVLAIVVITYLIGLGVKSVSEIKDEAIPVIAGAFSYKHLTLPTILIV